MKTIEKQKAINLRKKGMTISEIQKTVFASKGSISLWIQDIKLSTEEQRRIENKITTGQMRSRKVLRNKTLMKEIEADNYSNLVLKDFKLSKQLSLILCACLYECEGSKSKHDVLNFTNSDPHLIKVFLSLFRKGFDINEEKFRVAVHLHSYHDKNKQLKYWSKITNISLNQFIKPFIKKNIKVV